MKIVSLIITSLIAVLFIVFCSSGKNTTNSSDPIVEQNFYVSVYQNEQEHIINDFEIVNLKKEPFSIRFTVTDENPYAYLTAFKDNSLFDNIEANKLIALIPYFGEYDVMAPYEDGYRELFINDETFHILYYNAEYGDEYLIQPIKYIDEEKMLLEWEVNLISDYENDKEYELNANPYSNLYIVIFLDVNIDGIVNKGEFYRFELHF
jgi:hypothetical protein